MLTGYGAVFYKPGDAGTEYALWDDIVERIMPGAFDRALREDDVVACFNHDPNLILGRTSAKTLSLSIDEKGLRYEITPSDSATAEHVAKAVERGDVKGSSFMFEVGKATWIEERDANGKELYIRQIEEVRPLYELGPVVFPAYTGTTAEATSRAMEANAPARFRNWLHSHRTEARAELATWKDSRRRFSLTRALTRLRAEP